MPPPGGSTTLAKELTVATRILQSSSNELSTSVSNSVKMYILNFQADVDLRASRMSSHTEEL